MGREMDSQEASSGMTAGAEETRLPVPLESRPGVLLVGSPKVGKRTLLSRLLSLDLSDESDSLPGILRHGWTIDTKYYSADLCVWTAELDDDFSLGTLRAAQQLTALVMVFDVNDGSTFVALKEWVSGVDLEGFEILLCVGNKADLLPGHPAHVAYRRRLQKQRELLDYGISETEGSRLLGDDDEPSSEIRASYVDWCSQRNIEFIEACAASVDFDKCLSVDGDSQGVERIVGALAAHMWPGMVLKSGERIMRPTLSETEQSDEDSDYEVEYERLSAGDGDQWTPFDEQGASSSSAEFPSSSEKKVDDDEEEEEQEEGGEEEQQPEREAAVDRPEPAEEFSAFENLEQLMSEIGSMRENLRLMPDFQRREAAAKLAMKMAAMFGEDGDSDG